MCIPTGRMYVPPNGSFTWRASAWCMVTHIRTVIHALVFMFIYGRKYGIWKLEELEGGRRGYGYFQGNIQA